MSRPAQRNTDSNDGGGSITETDGNTNVYANNLLLSVNGSIGTGHDLGIHATGAWVTQGGSSNVLANNVPINYTGNVDTCGHARVGGSPNVFIGTVGDYNLDITSAEVTFVQEDLDADTVTDASTTSYVATTINTNYNTGVSSGILTSTSTGTTTIGTPDVTPPPVTTATVVTADWNQFNENNIPYDTLMLTPKTSLAEFTKKSALWPNQPTPFGPNAVYTSGSKGDNKHIKGQDYYVGGVKQGTVTVPQILHNLSNLAANIWEPFKQRYPQAIITNTFRQSPPGGKSRQAQHGLGMAMDIQLPGASAQQYLEAATWIRDNLPFDQLLQEKAGSVRWLHVSHYSGFGYRVSAVNKVANCVVSPSYSFTPGLALLA